MDKAMQYSEAFKAKMIQKMSSPGGPSARALAREVGISQSTLSRWLRRAAKVERMSSKKDKTSRRPQDWTAPEKLEAVLQTTELSGQDLGEFLRQQGLHSTHLEQWRRQMLQGLDETSRRRSGKRKVKDRRVRELEKELRRKDKALAETAALLVLKKKPRRSGGTRATT